MPHRLILDTDIGDDIDDAFALALLLRCPREFPRLEIKTCFGDVMRRCRPAMAMLRAADAMGLLGDQVPEVEDREVGTQAGAGEPLSSKPLPHRLGRRYHYGDSEPVRDEYKPTIFWKGFDIAASIGPLTDLAWTLRQDRGIAASMKHIVMAGEFELPGEVEHNVRCDAEAAAEAFASGVDIDVIPWSIGPKVELRPLDVVRLMKAAARGDLICDLLVKWLIEFWRHDPGKSHMYDPMTIVALLHPEWFTWRQGRVSVRLGDGDDYGLTTFEDDPDGPHRVAFDVDAERARGFMMDRLCGDAS